MRERTTVSLPLWIGTKDRQDLLAGWPGSMGCGSRWRVGYRVAHSGSRLQRAAPEFWHCGRQRRRIDRSSTWIAPLTVLQPDFYWHR
jgi:hypothetical protein